jgi:hypothetical protein
MPLEREREWLIGLADKSNATFLVRDILGCTCPPEIFDCYRVESIASGTIPMAQMIMGERLLVRIVDAARLKDPLKEASEFLREGRAERDRRKLNRFRLVIIGSFSYEDADALANLPGPMDPKIHCHILPRLDLN